MLRFLAKASVTVFVVTVAVLVLGVLGFGIASIWGFGGLLTSGRCGF